MKDGTRALCVFALTLTFVGCSTSTQPSIPNAPGAASAAQLERNKAIVLRAEREVCA